MSFTVLEAEPSLNKYLYYFVSYLYFCCSKRFHNSHIAASFQVILKENRLQIYIKQWNCLVKSELFLYKSINFRECKDNQLSLPLKWYSQHLLRPPPPILHPPRHLLIQFSFLLSKTFRIVNFQQTDNGEAEVFEKQQMTQKRRRRSWHNQQMTLERIMRSWMRRHKSSPWGGWSHSWRSKIGGGHR